MSFQTLHFLKFAFLSQNYLWQVFPSKKLQFLSFFIDTEKMIVTLTQEKKDRLVEECQKLISKKQATIREVARVLGLIVSSFSGVDYGQLFYREIEVDIMFPFFKCVSY
jgi:hypothetical protein